MSIGFPRFSWWPWGRKEQDPSVPSASSSAASSSSSELDFLELDSLNFQATRGARLASRSGKVKRKWHSRKEGKGFDREHDMVMVPPDGGCMSGSESDGSDWSIGWLEPHAPEFQNDDEQDNSFAVLVPCYGRPVGDSSAVRAENRLLGALLSGFNDGYSAVGSVMCADENLAQIARDTWRSGYPLCRNSGLFKLAGDRQGGLLSWASF